MGSPSAKSVTPKIQDPVNNNEDENTLKAALLELEEEYEDITPAKTSFCHDLVRRLSEGAIIVFTQSIDIGKRGSHVALKALALSNKTKARKVPPLF